MLVLAGECWHARPHLLLLNSPDLPGPITCPAYSRSLRDL